MSALAQYLEREGLPTTIISLLREHSEAIRPPRSLWVTFELGRPLGAPNAPDQQRRVLRAALALLEAPAGPVLEDFPEEAPAGSGEAVWSCPVSFPAPETEDDTGSLGTAVHREVESLRPWYELGCERRRRTTVGLSERPLDEIVALLERYARTGEPPADTGIAPHLVVKHALDDLLAYYQEAVTAQPGTSGSSADVLRWFWTETRASELFRAVRDRAEAGDDPEMAFIATRLLVPRAAAGLA